MSNSTNINDCKPLIRDLWNQGLTASEIAAKIGRTRNSVMGAVSRMRETDPSIEKRGSGIFVVKKPRPLVIKPPKPAELAAIKDGFPSGSVGIMNLNIFSCRYIVKEGNHVTTRYCNKPIDKSAYCAEHYKICYNPVRK